MGDHGAMPGQDRDPEVGDAFGRALLAALEHGESFAVIERDDGLVDVDRVAQNYFGEPDEWHDRCRWALDRAKGRVLDIGAGAGRASLALEHRGHDVVALDVSPGALDVCAQRGVQHRFLGTVEQYAVTTPEPFDTFLALGNNLGFLESPERGSHFLRALEQLGHAGSIIVGTGLDPYGTDDQIHLAYHAANRQRARLPGQVTMRVRYRDVATPWFDLLWCSLEELAQICEPAGWTITDVFPGWLYGVVLERSPR